MSSSARPCKIIKDNISLSRSLFNQLRNQPYWLGEIEDSHTEEAVNVRSAISCVHSLTDDCRESIEVRAQLRKEKPSAEGDQRERRARESDPRQSTGPLYDDHTASPYLDIHS